MTPQRSIWVSIALLSGTGCGSTGGDSTNYEVVDSAGVQIVRSTPIDRPLDWTFEEAFRVGGENSGPGTFSSITPSSVATDSTGRIYAIDNVTGAVQVFGPAGAWLFTLGREGEGPGEFERPYSLAVTGIGDVLVYDLGKRALVTFGPDGTVLPEIQMELQPPPNRQRHLAGWEDGFIANISVRGPPRSNVLGVFSGSDTSVVSTMPIPTFQMKPYAACPEIRLRLPPVFWNFVAWDHAAERLAFAAWPDYAITVTDGTASRSVRRDLTRREATRRLALDDIGDVFELSMGPGLNCRIPSAQMLEVRGFEDFVPWIDALALAPSGELWVRRYLLGSQGTGLIDVFDSTGAYVGTVPEGGPGLPVLFLSGDRFGFIETDELDVQRLVFVDVSR